MRSSMTSHAELDWLRSVRQARGDLIHLPVLPVRTDVLPDDDGEYLCTGCDMVPDSARVFTDAGGWIWCGRCATSDVIGAAFTQAEVIALSGVLNRATERLQAVACGLDGWRWMQPAHAEAAAEVRAVRDAVTFAPLGGPVPADVLFPLITCAVCGAAGAARELPSGGVICADGDACADRVEARERARVEQVRGELAAEVSDGVPGAFSWGA